MSLEVRIQQRLGAFTLDINFATKGQVTALFGPSGAGKSTIVAAVAGLTRPHEGRIAVGDRVVLDSPGLFVPPEARRIAVVFQDARLFPHMRVVDNLKFGWRRAPQKAGEAVIAHVIELLGLAHLLQRYPRALSGGEKSRVALGRALLASPDMILLDEPLAALDHARREEILPYLEKLARETKLPMLYVSHQLDEVARLADEIVIIENGRVKAQGPVFDILTDLGTMTGLAPLGAVFDATVTAHQADGLTRLAFAGGVLLVPHLPQGLGVKVRVRLRAEDIMLALQEPTDISANNVLTCHVTNIRQLADHADVQLSCGATKLVSRITAASCQRLNLAPGRALYGVVKAVTVAREAD